MNLFFNCLACIRFRLVFDEFSNEPELSRKGESGRRGVAGNGAGSLTLSAAHSFSSPLGQSGSPVIHGLMSKMGVPSIMSIPRT